MPRSVVPAADGELRHRACPLFHLNGLAGDAFADDRGRWLVIRPAQQPGPGHRCGQQRPWRAPLRRHASARPSTTLATPPTSPCTGCSPRTGSKATTARDGICQDQRPERLHLGDAGAPLVRPVHGPAAGLLHQHRQRAHRQRWTIRGAARGRVDDQRDFRTRDSEGWSWSTARTTVAWRAGLDAARLTAATTTRARSRRLRTIPFRRSGDHTVRDAHLHPAAAMGAFLAARWRVTEALTGEVGPALGRPDLRPGRRRRPS